MPAPSEASIDRSSVVRVAASRSSIAASSASIPSPVSAETRKHGRSGGRRAAMFRRFSRSSGVEAVDLVPDLDDALPPASGSMPS